jgi:hypothetical protein
MTDTTQATAPTAAARVTIDDVRAALDGTDPNATNAGKVRALLGRGSFETIQKHLGTLRQELATAAAPPVAAGDVPALPTEVAQSMWLAAWTAAQLAAMARAEKLAAERDAALSKLATMALDVAGLVATVDEQAGQLEQAAAADAAHVAGQAGAAADRAQLAADLERSRAEMVKVQTDAAHAAALAEQGRDLMREELARLTDQIGELKAALYKRV